MDIAETRPARLRLARRASPPLIVFAAVALVTLLVETVLVDRKYAIFSGGFGMSQQLDRPGEIAAFLAGLLACHLLFLYGLFALIWALHGRKRKTPLFLFNFLFFVPALLLTVLVAKFEVLSYFSDAISFQVIRNLGGGSLYDALLYGLSDAGMFAIAALGLVVGYVVCFRLYRRYLSGREAFAMRRLPAWKSAVVAALLLPFLLLAVNRVDDARYALSRFNSYWLISSLLQWSTDFDGDGYSWFSRRIDAQPFDASRHPLALDIPNNGIDEDGIGGDFKLADKPAPALPPPVIPAPKKNVIIIVLESTRADTIGKRVDGRPIAPTIEAIARQGSRIAEAYSHVGFTTESLKSLFTGSLAPVDDRHSLFRDFRRNGYRIGVFSGQAEEFGDIAATVGEKRYSDIYVDAERLKSERSLGFTAEGSIRVDGQVLLREFDRAFGRSDDWRRPVFLYFNLQSAHYPYFDAGMKQVLPGKPIPRGDISKANRDWVAHTYWNAVAYDDWLIGQIVARLKALGEWDDSLLVIVADHGESLFDDGFLGHGHMLNRQQTRIPLVFSKPGVTADGPVGLDDIRGLLLRKLGAAPLPAPRHGPVFQFIGTLDRPAIIGMAEPGGAIVTLNLDTNEASPGASAQAKTRLVHLWEAERWRHHLDSRSAPHGH